MKPLLIGFTIMALALAATPATAECPSLCPSVCTCSGDTYMWRGNGADGNWTTVLNWLSSSVPPQASGSNKVVIDGGNVGSSGNTTAVWNHTGAGEYCLVTLTSDTNDGLTIEKEGSGNTFCIYTLVLEGFSDTNESIVDVDQNGMSAMFTNVESYVTVDVLIGKSVNLGCITVDADAASAYSRLDKIGAGTLDARTLELIADQDAENDAEFKASAGSFTPDAVILTGGPTDASAGEAILNVDVSVTVQSDCGTSATGFADVDVASAVTYTAKRCFFGEASFTDLTDINISTNGAASSVFAATSIEMVSGAASGDTTIVRLKTGDLTTSDLLRMSGTNDDVELEIDASADAVTIHSMEMNDDAELDMNGDVTVTNEFRVRDPNSGGTDPWVDLAASTTLTLGSFVVEPNVQFTPIFGTSAKIKTN